MSLGQAALIAARRTLTGELPPRYADNWVAPFHRELLSVLRTGASVLDVGGGRSPAVPPSLRPRCCRYVGLDVSAQELTLAPRGSYDEIVPADVTRLVPRLEARFDVVVSWQVLEHVKPLANALANIRAYLRPGGRLIALLSSGTSAFALVNRLLPARVGIPIAARVMNRRPETVHRAHYDHCYASALERLLAPWSTYEIVPEYRGAVYFGFSSFVQATYVAYEELAYRRRYANLATHYRIYATR